MREESSQTHNVLAGFDGRFLVEELEQQSGARRRHLACRRLLPVGPHVREQLVDEQVSVAHTRVLALTGEARLVEVQPYHVVRLRL